LVVSDDNHRIQVFRYIDGAHLRTIGSRGAGNGQFNGPWGIAFDGAGHIIVSERDGHRVQVLRYNDGAHVITIGSEGRGNGDFFYPSSIAVDGEGNVAVFDGSNYRVQVHRLRTSFAHCLKRVVQGISTALKEPVYFNVIDPKHLKT
jgi:tripartite motif-containing protein 71